MGHPAQGRGICVDNFMPDVLEFLKSCKMGVF